MFQTEPYFQARYQATARRMAYQATSPEAHHIWRPSLRAALAELLGIPHMLPTPLNSHITETVQCDGYRRERVEIDTEPGVTMPLYVLIPHQPRVDAFALITAHGHGSAGKDALVGLTDNPLVADKIKQHNYDYAVQAVRKGFIAFVPDARGFGERRERDSAGSDQTLNSSCFQLAHMALPLGLTVAGMWVWDLMRLIDYIATRPDTQQRKVAGLGFSGGGLQMLYLAALDARLAATVISGYFYGVRDSLLHLSMNCPCNYVPHLWELADMGDIGALISPRPLFIESARQDPLNGPRGIINVQEQVDIARQAYAVLGAEDRLATHSFDGPHTWHGATAFDWLLKQ